MSASPQPPHPIPSPRLTGVTAFRPRAPRPGVDLFLDANEGPPPPAEVFEALLAAGAELLRRYPKKGDLESRLAGRFGVDPARLLVTAGTDESIDRCCRCVLWEGREAIVPMPTFEMVERYVRLSGGMLVEASWPLDQSYPAETVLERVTPATALISVVSPNNPTGAIARPEDLRMLSRAAPHALLLVDLAYAEFVDAGVDDLMETTLALPNALTLRTFSKAWGLAGLRVGCAIGSAEIIDWMRRAGGPFTVAAPSIALATAALDIGDEYVRRYVERTRQERRALSDVLREIGAEPMPSQANFVLARFADAAAIAEALLERGISVRHMLNQPQTADCLRITCPGDERAFDRLVGALRECRR